jgi:ketosteroid isomerase-like protein
VSQENVEVVRQAIAAVNARDIDTYLGCCPENVRLETPLAPLGASYEGQEAVRRFFADVADTAPDFRITLESAEAARPDMVIASLRVSSTGRVSGIPMDNHPTNVYDLDAGRIARVRIFPDRREALKAVGLEE